MFLEKSAISSKIKKTRNSKLKHSVKSDKLTENDLLFFDQTMIKLTNGKLF
jgi:hypothetical protein